VIKVKRVYDLSKSNEKNNNRTFAILVDRLWPRGLAKDKIKIDLWLNDIAPSDKLRKWFAHDPIKWEGFKSKYKEEILNQDRKMELLRQIKQIEKVRGSVLLLFSAKDKQYNNATALSEILNEL
jgi:uncharacterized protein YeaO (DUF488 family)